MATYILTSIFSLILTNKQSSLLWCTNDDSRIPLVTLQWRQLSVLLILGIQGTPVLLRGGLLWTWLEILSWRPLLLDEVVLGVDAINELTLVGARHTTCDALLVAIPISNIYWVPLKYMLYFRGNPSWRSVDDLLCSDGWWPLIYIKQNIWMQGALIGCLEHIILRSIL